MSTLRDGCMTMDYGHLQCSIVFLFHQSSVSHVQSPPRWADAFGPASKVVRVWAQCSVGLWAVIRPLLRYRLALQVRLIPYPPHSRGLIRRAGGWRRDRKS